MQRECGCKQNQDDGLCLMRAIFAFGAKIVKKMAEFSKY